MAEVAKEKQTELEAKANALVEQARTFTVDSPHTYTRAIDGIDAAKRFQAEVKSVWDPVCNAANTAHKTATAGRKDQMAPFLEAEKLLKQLCNTYDIAQEKLRRDAQKKIDDEAARVEADRLKKEADAIAEAEALVRERAVPHQ